MCSENWSLIGEQMKNVWIMLGPLAGVLVGVYLTGRSARRKWLADNQKEEYRELLTALVTSFDEIGTNLEPAVGRLMVIKQK